MELEKLGDFIIPIVVLFLYFVLNAKKKKEPLKKQEEEPRRQPPQKKPTPSRQTSLHIPRIAPTEPVLSPPQKRRNTPSYARKLVKGKSLRTAFLLKEILNRPYE